MFIGIAGIIGAGKSTLTKFMTEIILQQQVHQFQVM